MGDSCYSISESSVSQWSQAKTSPCGSHNAGNYTQCCFNGDTCLQNGICGYSNISPNRSGYYIGGCTDPSFKDPACPRSCRDALHGDITFNKTTNSWQCCAEGANSNWADSCSVATNITFPGPSPENLQLFNAVGAIRSQNATASSTITPTSVTASSSSTAIFTDGAEVMKLSDGAKIGVAVGIIFGGFAIFAVASTFYTMRGRWRGVRRRMQGIKEPEMEEVDDWTKRDTAIALP